MWLSLRNDRNLFHCYLMVVPEMAPKWHKHESHMSQNNNLQNFKSKMTPEKKTWNGTCCSEILPNPLQTLKGTIAEGLNWLRAFPCLSSKRFCWIKQHNNINPHWILHVRSNVLLLKVVKVWNFMLNCWLIIWSISYAFLLQIQQKKETCS